MKNILWFKEIGMIDVESVGGKGASLGEMENNGFPVPTGFVITSGAYFNFLIEMKIQERIVTAIDSIDVENTAQLEMVSANIRTLIENTKMPNKIKSEIINNYRLLSAGKPALVAVRSSATAEDLPEASFAGQQETYLNILGEDAVVKAVQKCWASLFTARAVYYRKNQGFGTEKVGLCAVVQKMVESEVSGIMFTADPTGDLDKIIIEAGFGLGETVVSGSITPDNYVIDKKTMTLINKKINKQEYMLVKEGNENVRVDLGPGKASMQKMSDEKIIELAKIGQKIEDHYKKPMDIEWGMENNILYIVQARPITTLNKKVEGHALEISDKPIIAGLAASPGVISGIVKVVPEIEDVEKVMTGDILVTKMTSPSWVPVMKKAIGIITNEGGKTCFDGETKVLTNKGFMKLSEIYTTGFDGLEVLSFNKNTLKTEWKPIVFAMKRTAPIITVSISQTRKINHNLLTLTPDHKMVNIRDAQLVDTPISEMIAKKELVCIAQKIPELTESTEQSKKMAYLLGGIMTDGSIYRSRIHGTVQFIQKETLEKEAFINHMKSCVESVYQKAFKEYPKKVSTGFIRGKPAIGSATAFSIYSKELAYDLHEKEEAISTILLKGDLAISHNFLAGVIDGDGTFYNNRINIYISETQLLEGTVIACLKIGIVPQVTKNRHIWNVQIVEKLDEILSYTKRVKGTIHERTIKTRFFSAQQTTTSNTPYRTKERGFKNLLVSDKELMEINNDSIKKLLASDLRMQRVIQ
ncbi:MAG: PEP-utilizing enzyme, partial [Candidatus Diapherotrites archaeon]|nr:PEP-utilizing enzyme [Candidatus Diapherotrites archaeon]